MRATSAPATSTGTSVRATWSVRSPWKMILAVTLRAVVSRWMDGKLGYDRSRGQTDIARTQRFMFRIFLLFPPSKAGRVCYRDILNYILENYSTLHS